MSLLRFEANITGNLGQPPISGRTATKQAVGGVAVCRERTANRRYGEKLNYEPNLSR